MNVSLDEAQRSLKALIERSAQEPVVIVEAGRPVARIVPVTPAPPRPRFGSCRGMLQVVAEDKQHLRDFADYMP